jgi:hypothetical protein
VSRFKQLYLTSSHETGDIARIFGGLRAPCSVEHDGSIYTPHFSPRRPPHIADVAGHYYQATALSPSLGVRPLPALCRLGLGLPYRHTGGMEQVRAERSVAVELLPGMELILWVALSAAGGLQALDIQDDSGVPAALGLREREAMQRHRFDVYPHAVAVGVDGLADRSGVEAIRLALIGHA